MEDLRAGMDGVGGGPPPFSKAGVGAVGGDGQRATCTVELPAGARPGARGDALGGDNVLAEPVGEFVFGQFACGKALDRADGVQFFE